MTTLTPVDCNFHPSELGRVSYFTDAKITRVALYCLAALGVGLQVGLISFTAKLLVLPLAIPAILLASAVLMIGTGLFIYQAVNTHDYENPSELQQIKALAVSQTFDALEEAHGLENIALYGIVTPAVLKEKFQKQHQVESLSQLLYILPLEKIISYQLVLHARLRFLFLDEVRTLKIEDVHRFHSGRLPLLLQHKIITQAEFFSLNQALERLTRVRRAYDDRRERIDRDGKAQENQAAYDNAVALAERTYIDAMDGIQKEFEQIFWAYTIYQK